MKIKYESTKRKKDIARSKIAYQKYAKSIDEPIELQNILCFSEYL